MHIHICDLNKHFSINSKHMGFYFVIPSPRFELPMGAAEQPTLPQQVQSHQKVCEFLFYNYFFFSKTGLMLTLILMFHLKFNLQQQNMQPANRSSQSLIQLTNTNVNNNQRMPYAGGIGHSNNHMGGPRGPRPLDQVTCYKVGRHLILCINYILCFFSHYYDALKCTVAFIICVLFPVRWEGPLRKQMLKRTPGVFEWTVKFSTKRIFNKCD